MKTPFVLLVSVVSVSAWAATPPSANFFQPTKLSMGAPPAGVAVADVNGDGFPDVLTANKPLSAGGTGSKTTISVLLNQGDGTFGAPITATVGKNPSEIVVADFNGDGRMDIVVATSTGFGGQGDLELLLGNGDGTFGAAQVIASQVSSPLAVADFNGDGNPDLAAEGALGIVVFLGTGRGGFNKLAVNTTCAASAPFAVGDFNGDGVPDIASLCSTGSAAQNLLVLKGNGNGTFRNGQFLASIGSNVQGGGVVAAHFNGSVPLGLAVSLTGPSSSEQGPGSLLLYTGDGHGNFTLQNTLGAEVHPKAPITADFNNDGWPDIAIPNLACDSLSIYMNDGAGNFTNHKTWMVGAFPVEVAAGDFNQDGVVDLVVTDNAESTVALLKGTGPGVFNAPLSMTATHPLNPKLDLTVATADFNNDGNTDILTGAGTIFLGDGLGAFSKADPVAPAAGNLTLTAVLTSSRNADIVTASGSTLTAHLGAGNATFPMKVVTSAPGTIQAMTAGDFNRDGATDLVVLVSQPSQVAGAYLFLGTYSGVFQTPQLIASGNFTLATSGVFQMGGTRSVVLVQQNATGPAAVLLFPNYGIGTFGPQVVLNSGMASITSLLTADVNGDGSPDLILGGTSGVGANAVTVLIAKNDGSFKKPKTSDSMKLAIPAIAAADFNGDGNVDVAVSQGNAVVLLLGKGDGSFVKQDFAFTVPGGDGLAAAQLTTGGGVWDLIVGNSAPDSVWTFLNITANASAEPK